MCHVSLGVHQETKQSPGDLGVKAALPVVGDGRHTLDTQGEGSQCLSRGEESPCCSLARPHSPPQGLLRPHKALSVCIRLWNPLHSSLLRDIPAAPPESCRVGVRLYSLPCHPSRRGQTGQIQDPLGLPECRGVAPGARSPPDPHTLATHPRREPEGGCRPGPAESFKTRLLQRRLFQTPTILNGTDGRAGH